MSKNKTVVVTDSMQKNYHYELTEPEGKNFAEEFKPELTPKELLALGIFGGKYMTDGAAEFPKDWFTHAKLCPDRHDPTLNFFGVNASQPLAIWKKNGWLSQDDPRGWFQWYCRYYLGRRIPMEDERQIKRWKAMKRHIGQLKKYCWKGDFSCRKKQRQALLHWAYDSRNL